MAQLTPTDHRALAELNALWRSQLPLAEMVAESGRRLARHVGADGHCFLLLDSEANLPTGVFGSSPALPGALEVFFRRVFGRTPLADWSARAHDTRRAVRPEDLLSDVEHDPFVSGLMRDYGWEAQIQVSLTCNGQGWGCMDLHRRRGRSRFGEGELLFLEAAAPLLAKALCEASARTLLTAIPAVSEAVLTFDPAGCLEAATAKGGLLAGELLPNGDTPVGLLVMAEKVKQALQRGEAMPPQRLLFVDPRRGERSEIHGELLTGRDGRRRGLVIVRPLRALDDPALLARLHLTPREVDCTLASVRGFSTAGAARFLGLSAHTVEHHMSKVFLKLGVATRGELAALLLGG